MRQNSGCQIRITDPGTSISPDVPANPEERLVTITGQPANINIAVQMLYSVSSDHAVVTDRSSHR